MLINVRSPNLIAQLPALANFEITTNGSNAITVGTSITSGSGARAKEGEVDSVQDNSLHGEVRRVKYKSGHYNYKNRLSNSSVQRHKGR